MLCMSDTQFRSASTAARYTVSPRSGSPGGSPARARRGSISLRRSAAYRLEISSSTGTRALEGSAMKRARSAQAIFFASTNRCQ